MKRSVTKPLMLTALVFFMATTSLNSQQNSEIYQKCRKQLGSEFIHSGQPMRALLTGAEVAEFRTTMFEGNTYRISTCSPEDQDIWFSVYDSNNNLIFSSTRHDHAESWDFKMEGNMECVIEAGLLSDSNDSGMALVMIGFKNDTQSQE
ncbi:MAG: hypothetical protein ACOC1E_03425 [Marinilabiliaceae bacterium]